MLEIITVKKTKLRLLAGYMITTPFLEKTRRSLTFLLGQFLDAIIQRWLFQKISLWYEFTIFFKLVIIGLPKKY